jgi:hypothetical protein
MTDPTPKRKRSLTRYRLASVQGYVGRIVEDRTGGIVLWPDHEKAVQRIAEEERERLGIKYLEQGAVPQPFWNDFGDAMMGDPAVVAALDRFSFDGRGYSVATANRMREAFTAAFGIALAALDNQEAS